MSEVGWSAITAIGTFSAAIVALWIALFQDRIRAWWSVAKLDFSINLEPPNCHKIERIELNHCGQIIRKFNVIYLRIRVQHNKGKSAENVEIMVTDLKRINGDGKEVTVQNFLPMNLQWSNLNTPTDRVRISSGFFRYCDLGYMGIIKSDENENKLKLDTIQSLNLVEGGYSNFFIPGIYKFTLLLGGDNVKPKSKSFILEFDKAWSENELEMLNKHINIKEI